MLVRVSILKEYVDRIYGALIKINEYYQTLERDSEEDLEMPNNIRTDMWSTELTIVTHQNGWVNVQMDINDYLNLKKVTT